jgi:hypothetical protein
MPKQSPKPDPARQEPGLGGSTSEAAFNDLRRQIAQRNEQASQQARKRRGLAIRSSCSGAANATSRAHTVSHPTGIGLTDRPEERQNGR